MLAHAHTRQLIYTIATAKRSRVRVFAIIYIFACRARARAIGHEPSPRRILEPCAFPAPHFARVSRASVEHVRSSLKRQRSCVCSSRAECVCAPFRGITTGGKISPQSAIAHLKKLVQCKQAQSRSRSRISMRVVYTNITIAEQKQQNSTRTLGGTPTEVQCERSACVSNCA